MITCHGKDCLDCKHVVFDRDYDDYRCWNRQAERFKKDAMYGKRCGLFEPIEVIKGELNGVPFEYTPLRLKEFVKE